MDEATNCAWPEGRAGLFEDLRSLPSLSRDMLPVLLYEDDQGLASEMVLAFAAQGHDISVVENEVEILEATHACGTCVLIMDRMVHGVDSLAIVARLRESGDRTPVIVISNMASVDDRIRGLKAGGDDYLVKPFSMAELMARVEALMRRSPDVRGTQLVAGDLVMDLIDRSVRRGARKIALLPREFTLLEFFMRRPGQVITRAMMLEGVWNYKTPINTNVVDVHMSNLRRKIDVGDEPQLIKNRRGIGFILTPECSPPRLAERKREA